MKFFKTLSDKISHLSSSDIVFKIDSREELLTGLYLFIIFILCFIKLDNFILPQLDDMTHAAMGASILQTGDWFTMHEGAVISWLKPPLYFWAEAILFKIFEVSEYWSKFPVAITGFLTFLFSYKLAEKLFGKRVGFLTLFVLSTSMFFLRYTQRVMLDMPVTFALTLSIFAVVKAEKDNNDKFYLLYGLGLAFGYYFKGLQGLYALGIIPLYFIVTGQFKKLFNSYFLLSILEALFLMGLWAVPQYLTHGKAFLLSQSGIGPLLSGGLAGHTNPFYRPFKEFFRMFYWFIPALYGMYLALTRLGNKDERNGFIILFLWFSIILAALSVSSVFGVRYLIPALVPAGIFAAIALNHFIKPKQFLYFQHTACLIACGILILIAVLPVPPVKKGTEYISLYRCVNNIVSKNSKIILYKEKSYIFNQGLTFYSARPLDKQVQAAEDLISEVNNTEKKVFIISNPEDYEEIKEIVAAERLFIFASSDKWILFQIDKGS
ncbi:MAG: glycosyltransferase family 39 protein [Elusimicrobia bacterium]|nr:glycosyltransferase family 39 protein [Elusimicrobiota bacterium]